MAGVFQSLSISSAPPPGLQRLHSPVCPSLPSPVAAQAGKVRPCALAMQSSGFPRGWSGNLLMGQKLRIRVPPRLLSQQRIHVSAERADLFRVLGVVVKTGREALEAGSRLVPEPVPRPVAQAGVALAALVMFSLVLKSVFSTAIFIVAIGGICYAALAYLGRDSSSASGGSGSGRTNGAPRRTDADAVEEARRIMEKYK